MIKAILLFGLFSASLFLHGCKTATADNLTARNEQPIAQTQSDVPTTADETAQKIEKTNATSQTVNFRGVSFKYNPQIFGAVKMEEIAEQPLLNESDKPDYVTPQNRLFTFDLSTSFSDMYIAVYPLDDFPRMYAVDKGSVEGAIKENENLKKVLKDKNFRVENQIPYLPFIDAGQTFQAKVKHFDFPGGKGILFLTFWETQFEFPSNRQLRYVFEGLTNDGKYYILAEMPVSVDFLPEESSDEYEGYKIYGKEKFDGKVVLKRMSEVNKKIGNRLENLPENEFKPKLKNLEEVISSLKIEQ